MNTIRRTVLQEPFIFATGLAALAHSTWALGTLFSGPEPSQFTGAWFAWLIPALLIAFSLDVGQIVTSSKIRTGERTRGRYATFATFAVATYYLQWLYISHHMPQLTLAEGVGSWSLPFSSFLRDMAQWVIPLLLPLSTVLYTFSDSKPSEPVHVEPIRQSEPQISPITIEPLLDEVTPLRITQPDETSMAVTVVEAEKKVICSQCGWSRVIEDEALARRVLKLHMTSCTGVSIMENVER